MRFESQMELCVGVEIQWFQPTFRSVDGQLQRAKKQICIRGLNRNCDHDLKNLFKGAAIALTQTTAIAVEVPVQIESK
jgi:hypothetical protein